MNKKVSVSLRSIIHSYNLNVRLYTENNVLNVSVSLRSIIHSYDITDNEIEKLESFRLLTEYHSFLYVNVYYNSKSSKKSRFPSPYGVSFILILEMLDYILNNSSNSFRLLTEYHSFLYNIIFYLYQVNSNICFRLLTEYHSFL